MTKGIVPFRGQGRSHQRQSHTSRPAARATSPGGGGVAGEASRSLRGHGRTTGWLLMEAGEGERQSPLHALYTHKHLPGAFPVSSEDGTRKGL